MSKGHEIGLVEATLRIAKEDGRVKANLFRSALANLLETHNANLYIEIDLNYEHDEPTVELLLDLDMGSYGNILSKKCNTDITHKMIRDSIV